MLGRIILLGAILSPLTPLQIQAVPWAQVRTDPISEQIRNWSGRDFWAGSSTACQCLLLLWAVVLHSSWHNQQAFCNFSLLPFISLLRHKHINLYCLLFQDALSKLSMLQMCPTGRCLFPLSLLFNPAGCIPNSQPFSKSPFTPFQECY